MRGIWFFIFIFFISFCSAIPEILFDAGSYQPGETIVGTIRGSISEISRENLKIYEGRREVFFEKEIMKHNGTVYFYIIAPKEGDFSIQLSNILYMDEDNIKSANLQKNFSISFQNGTLNEILAIRPGIYRGTNPKIYLENVGNKVLNISYGARKEILYPGKTSLVDYEFESGLNRFAINSYREFIIFVFKQDINSSVLQENNTSEENTIPVIADEEIISLSVPKKIIFQETINTTIKMINITNNGSINLNNLEISTEISFFKIENNINISPNETRNIEIMLNLSEIGAYYGDIDFYLNSKKIASTAVELYVFRNNDSAERFSDAISENQNKGCSTLGGNICDGSCSGDFYLSPSEGLCCFGKCSNNQSGNSNIFGIIFGLIILGVVGWAGYYFYMKSKRVKLSNPADRFKQIDKNYQKKIGGKN